MTEMIAKVLMVTFAGFLVSASALSIAPTCPGSLLYVPGDCTACPSGSRCINSSSLSLCCGKATCENGATASGKCFSDNDCQQRGGYCYKPYTFFEGVCCEGCPSLPIGTVGICVDECSKSKPCPGGQLCCSNGCGHTCQTPGS